MIKPLSLFVGWRYIRSRRQNGFLSFISLFTFLAMALGVAVLLIVLSVMNGFEREIRERLLTVLPHLTVLGPADMRPADGREPAEETGWQPVADRLQPLPGVQRVAPYISGYGMMSAFGHSQALKVQGIDPRRPMFALEDHLVSGQLEYLQPGEFGLILGELAARRLGVVPGHEVRLTLPQASVTPMGLFPRERRMTVVGLFRVGADVDATHAFVHIDDAARLYRASNGFHGLQVQLEAPLMPAVAAESATAVLDDGWSVTTWEQDQATLFQAMRMEKVVVGLLLTIIIVVAAFNIVANLVLMVADKRKDIAVLRTLGCSSGMVMAIFMVQGVSLGLAGIVAGGLLGTVVALSIGPVMGWLEALFGFQVFDASVYFISQLPSDPRLSDFVGVVGAALVLSILAALYPAWRAGQIPPAEVLRYHQ